MSYLSELLGEGATRRKPKAPVDSDSKSAKPGASETARSLSSGLKIDATTTGSSQKRKAGSQLNTADAKISKRSESATQPYLGTARSTAEPGPPSFSARPSTKPPTIPSTKNGSKATSAGSSSPPRPPMSPAPGQPLSRYQQLLARGAAMKATSKPVGSITHKQAERLSKRERLALEAEAKQRKKSGGVVPDSRRKGATPDRGSGVAKVEKKDYGYSGTMRPKAVESDYKGTMGMKKGSDRDVPRRGVGGKRADAGPGMKKGRYAGYTFESESDLEDDLEDSGLSDMEAGAFEMEEEEFRSLRAARKEDEEALKEEEAHQREKLERRRRLEELGARRRGK
ncbi:hypothetical protein P152DRAFT_460364 [Eremomyces bilateralis CBS 781.70]|uniref:SPT2-domain-containing protein n=1 Tax=Eremomyces bilateralis CBS 781.70 TaxID=1392243 RepID=A0A6G1FYN0_9PEZI|nr:uncharacterized protein P152DRAFT_460364 [Eremomyces bilateralis CBS 781.70]KAF1810669.1 hypothetical protein P152DRAFT_460364 [Eremomyces bilateralis CBS 781.70]